MAAPSRFRDVIDALSALDACNTAPGCPARTANRPGIGSAGPSSPAGRGGRRSWRRPGWWWSVWPPWPRRWRTVPSSAPTTCSRISVSAPFRMPRSTTPSPRIRSSSSPRGRTLPGKPSTAGTCRFGIPTTPWAHPWHSTCSRPRSAFRCSWPTWRHSASPTPRSCWSRSSWPAPECCSSAGSWASGPWRAPSPGRCSN